MQEKGGALGFAPKLFLGANQWIVGILSDSEINELEYWAKQWALIRSVTRPREIHRNFISSNLMSMPASARMPASAQASLCHHLLNCINMFLLLQGRLIFTPFFSRRPCLLKLGMSELRQATYQTQSHCGDQCRQNVEPLDAQWQRARATWWFRRGLGGSDWGVWWLLQRTTRDMVAKRRRWANRIFSPNQLDISRSNFQAIFN